VETFRRHIESTSLHRPVERVEIRNITVLGRTSTNDLKKAVEGSSFEAVQRRGKQLFLELSKGGWMTWHFGMTGEPVFFEEEGPRFARVVFYFKKGALAFDDPRMLGRIGLTPTVEAFVHQKKLGPDALTITKKDFLTRFGHARGAIKPALMDQHRLAGIGNIYADEILFQSRLDPRTELKDLDRKELGTIHAMMKRVLRLSIERGTDFSKLPDSFLLHHRRKGAPCPRCGGTMETITLGGRTTYYCPACQGRSSGER
jgi:formamidopyrimidine-DNA glycosylase